MVTERAESDNDDLYGDRPHSAAEYAAARRERQAERMRRARKARTRRLQSGVVGFGALLIVLVAGWLIVAGFSQISAVSRGEKLLDDADRIVVQVDGSVSGQDRAAGAERARGVAERIPGARELLKRSSAEIAKATPPLTWVWSKPRRLADAVKARQTMLVPAPALLEISAQSSSASPLADSAWEAIERANAETSASIPPAGEVSAKDLAACTAAADAVAGDLALAQQGFVAAQTAFPEASFGPYLEYTTLLQKANRATRQASKYLEREMTITAATRLRTRASTWKKAADKRRTLTLPVEKAVDAGVVSAAGTRLGIYNEARAKATAADERLGRTKLKAQASP